LSINVNHSKLETPYNKSVTRQRDIHYNLWYMNKSGSKLVYPAHISPSKTKEIYFAP